MKPEEAYQKACEDIASKVNSWDDLYQYFESLAEKVRQRPGPLTIMDAFFAMYAFILALRALPEEGDARKLAEKMLHNLTVRPKEAMGFDLVSLSREEMDTMAVERLKEVVSALAATISETVSSPPDEAEQGTQQKRVLH